MPVDFDLPFPVLPFPGSASVSCTYSTSSPGACQPGEGPGVSVGTEGTLEIERSDTTLDAEGCPTQTLSVTASLELQTSVSGETPVASGSLTSFLGEATTYSVTVPPDAADAIEHGDRTVPNPVDPRTIRAGESVELSQEFYAGHDLEASYRALQLELGYEEGTRVSAGVSRVNPSTVRIYVGDEDFVRNALSLGRRQRRRGRRARGRRRAERRQAAQRRHGHLHRGGLEGLPAVPEVRQAAARGHARHQRPDEVRRLRVHRRHPARGARRQPQHRRRAGRVGRDRRRDDQRRRQRRRLLRRPLQRRRRRGHHAHRARRRARPDPLLAAAGERLRRHDRPVRARHRPAARARRGQPVRFDFTPDDFAAIQEQAFDQLQWQLEQNRIDLSEDELRDIMAEYPHGGDPYGIDSAFNNAYELAAAETPEQVLYELYLGSGVGRDGDVGLQSLIDFMMATTAARHDIHDWPYQHPDSLLPGTPRGARPATSRPGARGSASGRARSTRAPRAGTSRRP